LHLLLPLIAATMLQIGLGAQVRGGIDAALESGVLRANAVATVGHLNTFHQLVAFVVLLGAVALARRLRTHVRGSSAVILWSLAVVILAAFQIVLGVVLDYLFLSPVAQVLHLTVASLLLGAETVVLLVGVGSPALESTVHTRAV
jgi:hypothetical protein